MERYMISLASKTDQLKAVLLKSIKSGVYKPGDKLPSILSICKEHKVSKHTVSQALSNLSELGMLDLARGKATRVSEAPFQNNIEIIYRGEGPIEQQEFWSLFYQGITDEINATHGFSFSIRIAHVLDKNSMEGLKDSVGALIMGAVNSRLFDYLRGYGITSLLVYNQINTDDVSFVSCDYRKTIQQIVDLFTVNKRSKIAYIGHYCEGYAEINTNKYKLFLEAMKSNGLSIDPKWHIEASHDMLYSDYEAVKSLLAAHEQPDGIFLSSDALAPGVYRALYESGLKIPEDVMVAGCDNLQISKYMVPSLTTIELSRYEMGRTAAKNLIYSIQNNNKVIQTSFSPEIIIRESLNQELVKCNFQKQLEASGTTMPVANHHPGH
jgi:DNA-binding LacI/PurR family transcriptional regulator